MQTARKVNLESLCPLAKHLRTSPEPANADAVISTVNRSPVANGRADPFSIECFSPRLSQLVHGSKPTL